MGVAAGDFDGDGRVDLYVTNLGPNRLWRNVGGGRFEDVTATASADDPRWSVPAAFFDYDGDGRLDLFVANYVDFNLGSHTLCTFGSGEPDYCSPKTYRAEPDRLLRNLGDGRFEQTTDRAGLAAEFGNGLGAAPADLDLDGRLDLYVANDGTPNQMWMNQGGGRFENRALFGGSAVNRRGEAEAGMGIGVGDMDGDGDEDLYVTHITGETSTLYLNDGDGLFTDAGMLAGLDTPSLPMTGFGTGWFDFDNDGDLDLLAVNGAVRRLDRARSGEGAAARAAAGSDHERRFGQPNQLFRNLGGGRFEDASWLGGPAFAAYEVSRGAAFGDVDNDGDTDVLITNNSGPARLLLNLTGQDSGWIGLRAGHFGRPARRRRKPGPGAAHRRPDDHAPGPRGDELRLVKRSARPCRPRRRHHRGRPRRLARRRRGVLRRAPAARLPRTRRRPGQGPGPTVTAGPVSVRRPSGRHPARKAGVAGDLLTPCVVVFSLLACGASERLPLPSGYEAHDPAVRGQIASLERRVRSLEDAGAAGRPSWRPRSANSAGSTTACNCWTATPSTRSSPPKPVTGKRSDSTHPTIAGPTFVASPRKPAATTRRRPPPTAPRWRSSPAWCPRSSAWPSRKSNAADPTKRPRCGSARWTCGPVSRRPCTAWEHSLSTEATRRPRPITSSAPSPPSREPAADTTRSPWPGAAAAMKTVRLSTWRRRATPTSRSTIPWSGNSPTCRPAASPWSSRA